MTPKVMWKVLILGGDRHGEWVDVFAGSSGWVNIRTGDTHRIASMKWAVTDPGPDGTPVVVERYDLKMAIHPRVAADQQSLAIAQAAVQQLAMTEFMRQHAITLPAAETVPAPDTPAPLFGPDGRPS
jgi:hypothetical protein